MSKRLKKTAYFPVEEEQAQANAHGQESGYSGIDNRPEVSATVEGAITVRDRQLNGDMEPDPLENLDQLKARKTEIESKLEIYRNKNIEEKSMNPEWKWNPYKAARIASLVGLIGAVLVLSGVNLAWQGWMALGLAAVLLILRPWGLGSALRTGLVRLGEDFRYLGNSWRSRRLDKQSMKLELKIAGLKRQRVQSTERVTLLTNWVMAGFDLHRKRGESARGLTTQRARAKPEFSLYEQNQNLKKATNSVVE